MSPAATSPAATSPAGSGDARPFPVRGVIEGFYGNPWTHAQRLELIDFLAAHGYSTFVYGPKDDPLLRRRWREPYAGEELARFAELVARCADRGIELTWCISPGLSIAYASEADLAALVAKVRSVAALGVRRFGLLLDDIPPILQHEPDRARFADLAAAHAHVGNALLAALGPGGSLVLCPTVYRGRGTEPYLARLGAALDPRVDLFWTGRAICSPTLDLEDAEAFARTAGRPPTYWDNYPVNDVAMTFELHVGPYRGRDPELHRCARGIVANPMELFEASKIPLATIGDYLADPAGYDPEASWDAAIAEVAGAEDAPAFRLFADNVRSSCLADEDAPIVARALEAFSFRADRGEGAAAAADLAALAARLRAAADRLLGGGARNQALVEDCRPWLAAFALGAEALERTADLAAAGRLETDAVAVLRPYLARLRHARVRVFGDAVDMFLADLTETRVRPGEQLALEGGVPG